MKQHFNLSPQTRALLLLCLLSISFQGCLTHGANQIQWDSKEQILMSEASQVKLRSAQTRTYEATDKIKILRAAVSVMQDLFFAIEILNEELGIVSGKKLCNAGSDWDGWDDHPSYYLYETDELIAFNANYLTWGPFDYRNDLARLTITVRPKTETSYLVRASLQVNIKAVETPETYQKFFSLLNNALFLSNET